jgi:hypothetical protein
MDPDKRQRDPVEKAIQGSLLVLLNLTLKHFRFNSDSMFTTKKVIKNQIPQAGVCWKSSQRICWRHNYNFSSNSHHKKEDRNEDNH